LDHQNNFVGILRMLQKIFIFYFN